MNYQIDCSCTAEIPLHVLRVKLQYVPHACVAIVADLAGQIAAFQHVWSPTNGLSKFAFSRALCSGLPQALPSMMQHLPSI